MTITLNQLIEQVRDELLTPPASNSPESMYPFLFVDAVELEVSVTVSASAEIGGKIKIQVAELGSKITGKDQETHRIKVKLIPLYDKDETRRWLEQSVGPRVTGKMQDAALKGTAKDLE